MRKLNVNDFYNLGKQCETLRKLVADAADDPPASNFIFPLFISAQSFRAIRAEPCALTSSSSRAVDAVIASIKEIAPTSDEELYEFEFKQQTIQKWRLNTILRKIDSFETILANDMPEMSTFAVGQIGIMRTDDLLDRAHMQIAEPLREFLLPKAQVDLTEAGKCIAFRLSTAAAFHCCRAIETGMDQYLEALTGKPYAVSPSGGNNNWGAKTTALANAGADEKATELLTHIRKHYRNPVTHPNIVVDEHEAVDLFITSLSAMSMLLRLARDCRDAKTTPVLPGLVSSPMRLEHEGSASI